MVKMIPIPNNIRNKTLTAKEKLLIVKMSQDHTQAFLAKLFCVQINTIRWVIESDINERVSKFIPPFVDPTTQSICKLPRVRFGDTVGEFNTVIFQSKMNFR